MPDFQIEPIEVADRAGYKVVRKVWVNAGVDVHTNPPTQDEDMMMQMGNVLPPITGTLNRRFGYTTFSPKLDTGSGDHL
jgi:hypothetical protein